MSNIVHCKVIGMLPVGGVSKPGEVELDADRIHIDALVQGGHIQVLPVKAETKPAAKQDGK